MIYKATFRLFLANLLLYFLSIKAEIPAVIVFGDSSVDTGNNNELSTILKSNFQPYGRDFFGGRPTGRFSNGRLPSDFISEAFGLKPTVPPYLNPNYNITDFATGVCFASAGTGYDNATSDTLSVLPLWKEIEYYKQYQQQLRDYLGDEKANEIIQEAIYLLSMGTNDFLENYYVRPRRQLEFSVEEYQYFLIGIARDFVTDLYKLGARKLSLGGLPPMGCLPLERTTNIMFQRQCIEEYNQVAQEFNMKLEILVGQLNEELKELQLVLSNPYNILLEMIQKPFSFGFDHADVACCATGYVEMGYMCDQLNPFTCTDADKYIFWDAFHPTERTNNLVATHLMQKWGTKFL
ncbi:GDSL esterase/lipase At4g26790-like [Amaranthus tricolor]|uniref:GDSL esterase/lipase At4g26790-like n=1 Tax=Amaranthus tricolor TaxID=29722 RepID=UPI00258B496F|nr:GDSL esterase/lipase At4g26790-like [Amaranthus tricolor]XP_057529545.1 GDSL esterase/lipase At4g26790-like [Amaranthus tricolor]